MSEEFDLIVVGAGYRSTTFLGSMPEAQRHSVLVLEESEQAGGAFQSLPVLSSSNGRRFFSEVDTTAWGGQNDCPELHRLTSIAKPVDLRRVGQASEELWSVFVERGVALRFRHKVVRIELTRAGESISVVASHHGKPCRFKARCVVVASGRQETLLPELSSIEQDVRMSGEVLSLGNVDFERLTRAPGALSIVGAAHSAMSVLGRIEDCNSGSRPAIRVITRAKARIQYPSLHVALRDFNPDYEEAPAAGAVCPETGIVFRDSGLRHGAATRYRELAEGRTTASVLVRDAHTSLPELVGGSDLVVQATGYSANCPEISIDGKSWVPDRAAFTSNLSGRIDAPGIGASKLYGLRLEPTPSRHLDAHNFAAGSHLRVAKAVLGELAVS